MVEDKLELRWSPQRISGRLWRRFPTSTVMRVSHETIYRALFVQSRGDLRHELTRHLRSRRAMRCPTGVTCGRTRPTSPNGLLRRYLPHTVDMRDYSQVDLDAIADEVNGQPRQTLDFQTSSEALKQVLR